MDLQNPLQVNLKLQYTLELREYRSNLPITSLIIGQKKYSLILKVENISSKPIFLKGLEIKTIIAKDDPRYLNLGTHFKTDNFIYHLKNSHKDQKIILDCNLLFRTSTQERDKNQGFTVATSYIIFEEVDIGSLKGIAYFFLTEEAGYNKQNLEIKNQILHLAKISSIPLIDNFTTIPQEIEENQEYRLSFKKFDTTPFDLYLYQSQGYKIKNTGVKLLLKVPASHENKEIIYPPLNKEGLRLPSEFIILISTAVEPLETSLTHCFSPQVVSKIIKPKIKVKQEIEDFKVLWGINPHNHQIALAWKTKGFALCSILGRDHKNDILVIEQNLISKSLEHILTLNFPYPQSLILSCFDYQKEVQKEISIRSIEPLFELIDFPSQIEIGQWFDIIWKYDALKTVSLFLEQDELSQLIFQDLDISFGSYRLRLTKIPQNNKVKFFFRLKTEYQNILIIEKDVLLITPNLEMHVEDENNQLIINYEGKNLKYVEILIELDDNSREMISNLSSTLKYFTYYTNQVQRITLRGYNKYEIMIETCYMKIKPQDKDLNLRNDLNNQEQQKVGQLKNLNYIKKNYNLGQKFEFSFILENMKDYQIFFKGSQDEQKELSSILVNQIVLQVSYSYNLIYPFNSFLIRARDHLNQIKEEEIQIKCQYSFFDNGIINYQNEDLLRKLEVENNFFTECRVETFGHLIVGLTFYAPQNNLKSLHSLITSKIEDLFDPQKRKVEKIPFITQDKHLVTISAEKGYALSGLKMSSFLSEVELAENRKAQVSKIEALWSCPFEYQGEYKSTTIEFIYSTEIYTLGGVYSSDVQSTIPHFVYALGYYPQGPEIAFLRKLKFMSLLSS